MQIPPEETLNAGYYVFSAIMKNCYISPGGYKVVTVSPYNAVVFINMAHCSADADKLALSLSCSVEHVVLLHAIQRYLGRSWVLGTVNNNTMAITLSWEPWAVVDSF